MGLGQHFIDAPARQVQPLGDVGLGHAFDMVVPRRLNHELLTFVLHRHPSLLHMSRDRNICNVTVSSDRRAA